MAYRVLPDQDDLAGLRQRDQHDRFRVPDHVDRDLAAVWHPHAVAVHVEDLAVVNPFVCEAFWLAHALSCIKTRSRAGRA